MKVKQKKQQINRRYQNQYDLLETSNYPPPPLPCPNNQGSYPGQLNFRECICGCFKLQIKIENHLSYSSLHHLSKQILMKQAHRILISQAIKEPFLTHLCLILLYQDLCYQPDLLRAQFRIKKLLQHSQLNILKMENSSCSSSCSSTQVILHKILANNINQYYSGIIVVIYRIILAKHLHLRIVLFHMLII